MGSMTSLGTDRAFAVGFAILVGSSSETYRCKAPLEVALHLCSGRGSAKQTTWHGLKDTINITYLLEKATTIRDSDCLLKYGFSCLENRWLFGTYQFLVSRLYQLVEKGKSSVKLRLLAKI